MISIHCCKCDRVVAYATDTVKFPLNYGEFGIICKECRVKNNQEIKQKCLEKLS